MKKAFHVAKANINKHKGASLSLFAIILIVSALITVALSFFTGAEKDYLAVSEKSNSPHVIVVLRKDLYNPSFEDFVKEDSRVAQYEILEVLYPSLVAMEYGGEYKGPALILNLDNEIKLSVPKIIEQDASVPRERALYAPTYAKSLGYKTGDTLTMTFRNKPLDLTVAGFFDTTEFATSQHGTVKFFASDECYESLKQQFGSSVMIATRQLDKDSSEPFLRDFVTWIDLEYADISFGAYGFDLAVVLPVTLTSAVLIVFALLITFVALFVVRFRVASRIEDTMHEIGVMKSAGYTSGQISACHIMEYSFIALPAALLGVILPLPVFAFISQALLFSMTGFPWTLGLNLTAGLIAAALVVLVLLIMVWSSCRRIRKLHPVEALRGGIAVKGSRRNFFPLNKGAGGAQTRLGLKNTFAYLKTYVMIGAVIACISLVVVFMTAMFQAFVIDQNALAKMTGVEFYDIEISVTRHTDANAFAAELENMPEVRKTTMFDYATVDTDGVFAMGIISNDYERMESLTAFDGRLPLQGNEVAIPKVFADELGKGIGDAVEIYANGITRECVITGLISMTSNMGHVTVMTLEGYQYHDPNYQRETIGIYLNKDVSVDEFSETLKSRYGVINEYEQGEDGRFAAAKARAEEMISDYLEHYDIDSVEYAVIYNDEIILSGSSSEYRIETITDWREWAKAQIGSITSAVVLLTEVIAVISLIIIALVLFMTIRAIIVKRRRELGTLKSMGYTTKQLVRQLTISFLPASAAGILIGCVTGSLLASPLMSVMFAATGAYGSSFYVNPLISLLTGVLLLAFTLAIATISARKIRNISAYELLSE